MGGVKDMGRRDPKFYAETYDCMKCIDSNNGQACIYCLSEKSIELVTDLNKINPSGRQSGSLLRVHTLRRASCIICS